QLHNTKRWRAIGRPGRTNHSALLNLREQRGHDAIHPADGADAFRRAGVLAAHERKRGALGDALAHDEITRSETRDRTVRAVHKFQRAVFWAFRICPPVGMVSAPE